MGSRERLSRWEDGPRVGRTVLGQREQREAPGPPGGVPEAWRTSRQPIRRPVGRGSCADRIGAPSTAVHEDSHRSQGTADSNACGSCQDSAARSLRVGAKAGSSSRSMWTQ